jgi:hypothetical protein
MNPYILKGKLRVYDTSDEELVIAEKFVDFHFKLESVNAFYMQDVELINVVIGGQIYELEYNRKLFDVISNYFQPLSIS